MHLTTIIARRSSQLHDGRGYSDTEEELHTYELVTHRNIIHKGLPCDEGAHMFGEDFQETPVPVMIHVLGNFDEIQELLSISLGRKAWRSVVTDVALRDLDGL